MILFIFSLFGLTQADNPMPLRVNSYCETKESAWRKANQFMVMESLNEDTLFIFEKKTVAPPLPKENLHDLEKLKKNFRSLKTEELDLLSLQQKDIYFDTLEKIDNYNRFMDYILSLQCFSHSTFGYRYSLAFNPQLVDRHFLKSDPRNSNWQIEIYEASIDIHRMDSADVSQMPKKYIVLGPCPVLSSKLSCLEQIQ